MEARKTFIALIPAHFINDLYSNIVPPLLPLLMVSLSIGHAEAGALVTASVLLSALLQPITAKIADKTGRRKEVMITGFMILGTAVSLFSISEDFTLLVIAALFMSVGLSTYHPQAMSSLASSYSHSKGKVLGLHGISGSLGFSSAPLVITFLNMSIGWREALRYAFIPTLILSIILWKTLTLNVNIYKNSVYENQRKIGVNKFLLLISLSAFLTVFSFRGFTVFLPTYYFKIEKDLLYANTFLFLALIPTLIGAPIGGFLSDKLGRLPILVLSISLQSLLIIYYVMSASIPWITIFAIGMASALSFPVFMAVASDVFPNKSMGIGVMFGIVMAATAISPAITGVTIDLVGYTVSFIILSMVGFLGIIPLLIAYKIKFKTMET